MIRKFVFFWLMVFLVREVTPGTARAEETVPPLSKVVWIWLEGVSFSEMVNQGFVKSLIRSRPSVRFSQFKTLDRATQGNAIAMISGSPLEVDDNDLTRVFDTSIVDLLESKSIPWKVYAEDFPGSCYLSMGVGNYKRYRVPFLSFDRVQSDRYQCMKILNQINLAEDLKNGTIPQFSVIIPNLKNSGIEGGGERADETLKSLLSPFLRNEDLMSETTFLITTIQLNPEGGNSAFALIFGNQIKGMQKVVTDPVGHYHFLRTLEDGLSIGSLGREDSAVKPLVGFWN